MEDTIHKPIHEEVGDKTDDTPYDPGVHPGVACLPGLCTCQPGWLKLKSFVKAFHDLLEEKHIRTGSLVILTTEDFPVTVCFFLGVTLKKPLLQTVILANVDQEQVSFKFEGAEGLSNPQITTTYKVFADILASTSESLVEVFVEHWLYDAVFDENKKMLVVNVTSSTSRFSVNVEKAKQQQRKETVRLPFGLSATTRKRKTPSSAFSRNPREEKKQHQAESSDLNENGNQNNDNDDADGFQNLLEELGFRTEENEQEVDNEFDDGDDDIQPFSEEVANNSSETRRVAREVEQIDHAREVISKEYQSGKPMSEGSFFSRILGLGIGQLAVSGRSKCRNCNLPIAKGEVRFEWWWNKLRPNAWAHPSCAVALATKFDLKNETQQRLRNMAMANSDCSEAVRAEAVRILSALS